MKEPLILAHRTGMGLGPPNSLSGLTRCLDHKVAVIECDITFVDKTPFIWIDDDNHLLEKSVKSIAELDPNKVAYLKRRDCEEYLLTFWHLLNLATIFPGKIYLDIKYRNNDWEEEFRPIPHHIIDLVIDHVIQPIIKSGLAHKFGFITFRGGIDLLHAVKAEHKDISIDLMVVWPWVDIKNLDCLIHLDSITVGWKAQIHKWLWQLSGCSLKRIINDAHFANIQVNAGLVRTEKETAWLMEKGVDGIWTDNPLEISRFIKKIKGEPHE